MAGLRGMAAALTARLQTRGARKAMKATNHCWPVSYDMVRDGEVTLVPVTSDAEWVELRTELEQLRLCAAGDCDAMLSDLSQVETFDDPEQVTRLRATLLDARSPVVAETVAAMDAHAPELLSALPIELIDARVRAFRDELKECLRDAGSEEDLAGIRRFDDDTAIESETAMANPEETGSVNQPQEAGDSVEDALSSVAGELDDLTKLVTGEGESDVPTLSAADEAFSDAPADASDSQDSIESVIESALNEPAATDDDTPSDDFADSGSDLAEPESQEQSAAAPPSSADMEAAFSAFEQSAESDVPDEVDETLTPEQPEPTASVQPNAEEVTMNTPDETPVNLDVFAQGDETVEEQPAATASTGADPELQPVAEVMDFAQTAPSPDPEPVRTDDAPEFDPKPRRRRSRRSTGRRTPSDDVEAAINNLAAFLQDEVGELWDQVREAMEDVLADRDTVAEARDRAATIHKEMQAMRDEVARARRESRQLQTQLQNLRDETTRARQRADAAACDAQNASDRAIAAAREAESALAMSNEQ